MDALAEVLASEAKVDFWKEYTATALWSVGKFLYKDFPLKPYGEFVRGKPIEPESKMSVAEIMAMIKADLLKIAEKGDETNEADGTGVDAHDGCI